MVELLTILQQPTNPVGDEITERVTQPFVEALGFTTDDDFDGSVENAEIVFSGGTARTLLSKMEDIHSASDYGAFPAASAADNDVAFTTIAGLEDTLGPIFVPAGSYETTKTFYELGGMNLAGPGRIKLGGYKQARNRVFMTVDPGDPSIDRTRIFDGLTEKTHDQQYMLVGSAVGQTAGASYRSLTAAAQSVRIYDYVGGHNTDPASPVLGRTGAAQDVQRVFHGGQGDAGGQAFIGQVYSTRVGATHFLANPAVFHSNGGFAASGVATGAYLQHSEFNYDDNGLAVAAIDRVRNYNRTNAGNALSQVWIHDRPQSVGSASIDAFYAPTGKARRGLDFTPATLDTDKAAVLLKANDRIYFGASVAADPIGTLWCATTLGTPSLYYDGSTMVLTSSLRVTSSSAFQPQHIVENSTNDANAGYMMLRKGRSGAAVQVGDTLGTTIFQGLDSTGTPVLRNAAYFSATVESVSAGAVAARIDVFAGSQNFQFKSNGQFVSAGDIYRATIKLLGARKTGWTVPTGVATRTAFDTATVTVAELAERVKALIDDFHATAGHGLIGA